MVVLIMGILAVTVIPAFGQLSGSRQAAAANEVQRRFELARSLAMATGRPTGVRVDVAACTLLLQVIPSSGATPVAGTTATGEQETAWSVRAHFPEVTIVSFTNGDGSSSPGTVWFAHDGTPQARNGSGTLQAAWSQDATVRLTGDQYIHIRRRSGAVQR